MYTYSQSLMKPIKVPFGATKYCSSICCIFFHCIKLAIFIYYFGRINLFQWAVTLTITTSRNSETAPIFQLRFQWIENIDRSKIGSGWRQQQKSHPLYWNRKLCDSNIQNIFSFINLVHRMIFQILISFIFCVFLSLLYQQNYK